MWVRPKKKFSKSMILELVRKIVICGSSHIILQINRILCEFPQLEFKTYSKDRITNSYLTKYNIILMYLT